MTPVEAAPGWRDPGGSRDPGGRTATTGHRRSHYRAASITYTMVAINRTAEIAAPIMQLDLA